jgi:hypothetical protein
MLKQLNKLKLKILLLSFLFCMPAFMFAQYFQSTFTVIGNEVIVKIKSDQNLSGASLNYFQVDFRYAKSHLPVFTVTSSSYGTVLIGQVTQDPNYSDYIIQRFAYNSGAPTTSFTAGIEYEVFRFTMNGVGGIGSLGLVYDKPNELVNPYYEYNGNYAVNFDFPFYDLTDSDFTVNGENWTWRTRQVSFGKYWKNDAVNSSWNNINNWSDGIIPSASTNVTVLSALINPVVASGSVCNKLKIEAGASVEIPYNGTLTINGDLDIADNNSLVIKSTVSGTGSLITKGNVPTGDKVKIERYIAKDNSWHFLSSPVDAQLIKPNFAPNTVDLTFDFFKWDEGTSVVYPSLPWINIRATNSSYATGFDNFENGRGYLVAYSSAYGGNATHEFNGTLNNGDKSINVGYSVNYFNLVGNPYASAIDWDAAGYTNRDNVLENTDPSIWIWNNTNGNYGTYKKNVAGTNGVTNIIAPHQAYFVQSKAAGTYTTPNTARVHPGTQNFLKSTPNDLLRLKVSSTANNYSDEIIVNFNSNAATNEGVGKWYSMLADAPSLYSVKNNKNLSINTFPSISNNMVIPVSFIAGINGTYNINASELNSFAANTYIYLKDLKTNFIQDLNQNATYSFVGLTTDNTERFQILFAFSPLNISNQLVNNSNIYTFENTVYINSNETINQILVFNALGQLIKEINKTDNVNSFSMNGFPTAYYIVKVITDKSVSSEKIFVK